MHHLVLLISSKTLITSCLIGLKTVVQVLNRILKTVFTSSVIDNCLLIEEGTIAWLMDRINNLRFFGSSFIHLYRSTASSV